MPLAKLRCYDAIYFCGGSPEYLMKRIRRVRLAAPLRQFTEEGGVYVGVSAGSIIAAVSYTHLDVYKRQVLASGFVIH